MASFSGFWKTVGKGFATVGVYAFKGALWASQHPEVIAKVAAVAVAGGVIPQGTANKINQGEQIAGAVVGAVSQIAGGPSAPSTGSQG